MTLTNLTRDEWSRMSEATAARECLALAKRLPHGLRFQGLSLNEYAGQSFRVARCVLDDVGGEFTFVLIPGGRVRLGFDAHEPIDFDFARIRRVIDII